MAMKEWKFRENSKLKTASAFSIKLVLDDVKTNVNPSDERTIIPLGHGDPSSFPCFRTTQVAEDAVVDALRSANFNGYAPKGGVLQARRSIAEYLSRNLPYKLSPDDVYVTLGAKQAIEVVLSSLRKPGANILLPKPGYPAYEALAILNQIEVRHFDLVQENGWEVDLNGLETMADDKTVAMVIINPGNPCGNIFSHHHLQKIAETARRLGILVISDEAYAHLTFGSKPFVPMGVFGSVVPVLTLGSLSKRWLIPGWRLGWIARNDPDGVFNGYGFVECIKRSLNTNSEAATFIQAAVPQILEKTSDDFFVKTIDILRKDAEMCYECLKDISCFTCPLEFLGLHEEDDEIHNMNQPSVSPNINQEVEINLIITDYCMPGMTGYDLLKKVKKSSSFKDIPVVIMSSENVPSRISRCLEEGAEEFFLKPVRLSDVNKLKPHMMRTKIKEIDHIDHQYNQEHEKHQEQNVLETKEDESTQQSNGNKRKSMEDGDLTRQNKTQIQWWPYCRFD